MTSSTATKLALAGLIVLAAVLRLRGLGDFGLWIDEDLTWLSVRGVLDEGIPRHPSGGVYLRAPIATYAAAASAAIFGLSEWSIRFPSVLFSLATILATFALGREVGGRTAGLVAAAIVALSPWDVHYARLARMYAPLAFFFTLSLHLAVLVFVRGRVRFAPWLWLASVAAVSLHPLGASLLFVYLAVLLIPDRGKATKRLVAISIGGVAVALVGMNVVQKIGWSEGPQSLRMQEIASRGGIPVLSQLELWDVPLAVVEGMRGSPLFGSALLLAWLGVAWAVFRRLKPNGGGHPIDAGLGILAGLSPLGHMPTVGLLAVAAWLKRSTRERGDSIRAAVLAGGAIVAASIAMVLVVTLSDGGPAGLPKAAFRYFLVPYPWWKLVLVAFPWSSVVVAAGVAFAFLRSLDRGADQAEFLLGASFAGSLVLMGFHEAPYTLLRYTFHLNPLFLVLFVLALRAFAGRFGGSWAPLRRAAVVAAVALVTSEQCAPLQSWKLATLGYGSWRSKGGISDVVSHYYFDTTSAGKFVAARRGPDDLVIVRDGPATLPYAGRVDYIVRKRTYDGAARGKDGSIVDRNLGVPVLDELHPFLEVLERRGPRAVWIVYSDGGPGGPSVNLPGDIHRWLARGEDRAEFVAGDGITRVLRFPPMRPAP